MALTKEQLDLWRSSPVTQAVIDELIRQREAIVEFVCTGGTVNMSDAVATLAQTVAAVKQIEALNKLIYMKVEDDESEV